MKSSSVTNPIGYSFSNNNQNEGSQSQFAADNGDVMSVNPHRTLHAVPAVTVSSRVTASSAEENTDKKDAKHPMDDVPNTETRKITLSVDSQYLNAKEHIPMLPVAQELAPTSHNSGKYKKIWRKVFPASDTELPVGFEAVLMELGDPGTFFWIQFVLHMLTTFSLTNTVLVYVFTGYEPPHVCKKLDNDTTMLAQYSFHNTSDYELVYGKCDITVVGNVSGARETVASFGCMAGHDYHGSKHISFVSEWDMVCDNVGLTEVVQVILLLGQTVGAFVFTSIADKYGRKPVLVSCNLLLAATGFGVAYAPNIYVMIAFRFLCGFFQQGATLVAVTLRMEFLTSKNRRIVIVLGGIGWTLTIVVFGLLAYFMRDASWRMLQTAAALFACNFILSALFLHESPRWLSANKKYDQTLQIIRKVCQVNKRDYQQVKQVYERQVIQPQEAKQLEASKASVAKVDSNRIRDMVRHKTLLISSLILCFIWMTNSVTYYGLYLTSSSLAGDRHLNFILIAVSGLPSDVMTMFLLACFGRKPVIMGWLLIAGSGLLAATMFMAFGSSKATQTLAVVFSCIGKLGIGSSFSSMFMYTPELFPTNFRSVGLGVCAGVSRFGSMLSPYSQPLAEVALWAPGLIFAAMCFLSAILFNKLPETRGQPMPDTIADMKQRVARHYGNKTSDVLDYEAVLPKPDEENFNSEFTTNVKPTS